MNKVHLGLYLFLAPLFSLISQEQASLFIIENYEYEIDGNTRERAIENHLYMPERPQFADYESMEAFASKQRQDLVNLRIFKSVDVELIPLPSPDETEKLYTLKISVVDNWTFFPILIPNYSTNDGTTLQLKITYANFFGTMMDFSIDGDFGIGRNPKTDEMGITFWTLETSMGNINVAGLTFLFSWIQSYDRVIKIDGNEVIEYYTFNESDFILSTSFDLGNDFYYEVAPAFELTYNYQDHTGLGTSYIDEEPQSYGIYQNYGRDQVDWFGNFQKGNNWNIDLKSRYVTDSGFKGTLIFSNRWFTIFNDKWVYGNRNMALFAIRDEVTGLGEYLRGVADFNLYGTNGFFSNNSFMFSLWDWKGVMETQLHPFTDLGLVFPTDRAFIAQRDLRMTLGTDFVLYPEFLPTVQLRLTLGYDLFGPAPAAERWEVLLSTSLFF